jgi:hypothetical protein
MCGKYFLAYDIVLHVFFVGFYSLNLTIFSLCQETIFKSHYDSGGKGSIQKHKEKIINNGATH